MSSEAVVQHGETHESGPHIPAIQGEIIHGMDFFGIPVSNTIFSTWLFMGVFFVFIGIFYIAIKTKIFPRLKAIGINALSFLDEMFTDLIGNKKYARRFLPVAGGFFIFIFMANIFGLILDWLGFVLHGGVAYLRPINSDPNTTLVMAVTIIVVAQITGIRYKGFIHHFKHYFFNWSGHSVAEKIINVPIGWIHFIGEFTRILSLSVRLFANIFTGVVLVAVMTYVGSLIPSGGLGLGGIVVIPFWFFEIFVAFLQAYIFLNLASLYLRESVTKEGH